MEGRAIPPMDRQVVGVVVLEVVAVVAVVTQHTQLLDTVWCSAVVLVTVV